jgi:hypothetical protein
MSNRLHLADDVSLVNVTRVEPRLTFTGRPASIRAFLGAEPRRVEGQFDEDVPIAELSSPRVLATTRKERTRSERIGSYMKKLVGLKPRNTGVTITQKGLDVEMDKFERTCLDGIALSVGEIGLVKRIFHDYPKGSHNLTLQLEKYCEIRTALLSKDGAFEEKYPTLYYQFLDSTQSSNSQFIDMLLEVIRDSTHTEFVRMNRQGLPNYYAENHMALVNTTLFDSDPDPRGYARQEKSGERGGKSRRKSRRKSSRRKSSRIKKINSRRK